MPSPEVHVGPAGSVEEEIGCLGGIVAGNGKTAVLRAVAEETGKGFIEIQATNARLVEDLVRRHKQWKVGFCHVKKS
jgi:hypothetical protein